jgi:hypothetical protein
MNIGFFLIGGIIFFIYIALTCWNIFYSHRKQREENYPNLKKNQAANLNAPSQADLGKSDDKLDE